MDGSQLCIGPLDTDMTMIVQGVIFADQAHPFSIQRAALNLFGIVLCAVALCVVVPFCVASMTIGAAIEGVHAIGCGARRGRHHGTNRQDRFFVKNDRWESRLKIVRRKPRPIPHYPKEKLTLRGVQFRSLLVDCSAAVQKEQSSKSQSVNTIR